VATDWILQVNVGGAVFSSGGGSGGGGGGAAASGSAAAEEKKDEPEEEEEEEDDVSSPARRILERLIVLSVQIAIIKSKGIVVSGTRLGRNHEDDDLSFQQDLQANNICPV
jgi:hypothetical protein